MKILVGVLFASIFTLTLTAQRVLSLQQSLEEASKNSPSLRQTRFNLEKSRESLLAQRAALKSNFALNVAPIDYSHGRSYNESLGEWITTEQTTSGGSLSVQQPIVATDGTISLTNDFGWQDSYTSRNNSTFTGFSNNLKLSLDQPIFTYNRTKMTLRTLEFNLENSQLNYELGLLSVEKSVTQAFYDVYQAQKNVIIAREDYQNRQNSYEIIKNKVDAGLVAKEELFQAELDMLSSKSSLQNSEVTLENTLDGFKQLLGIPLDDEIVVLAEVTFTPANVDLKQALNLGLLSRMELRQRQIDIEKGQFDLITTNASNEFKGNIGVTLGLSGDNPKLPNVYDNPTDNQKIAVSFTVPLYDWGEKKHRMKAAQAGQDAKIADLDDERISISLSIRQVYRSLANLLNQIDIARKNQENAQLTYDINLEKYKNGDLTSMDLNLVQNQLTQKKQGLTRALIQYKLELLNLKIQTLYDFETNTSIVPDFSKK